jgi:hypothetical protein
MSPSKWARVSQSEAFGLRRGAWYPVVSDGSSQLVVLDVNKSIRPVNRVHLEFRDERPMTWSVVRREPTERAAQVATAKALGPMYGVCPRCRYRAAVPEQEALHTCPACTASAEVDWDHPC